MHHISPPFSERLRVALGLGAAETPRTGPERRTRPDGTAHERGQVFADRLRQALDRG